MADEPDIVSDPSSLSVHVTKPLGQIAQKLAADGIGIIPILEDEGDVDRFVISKRLAIDCRTGHSFLSGIMDKTLFTGAIYLREHFEIPLLIVEGQVDYQYRGFDPRAVRGALSSMILEYGINVLCTTDPADTVQLLALFIRQEQVGIPEISLVPKRTAISLPDMQRRIVEMLPGCGRVMARALLQHFGSIERILDATEEELRGVTGIGRKKAGLIHHVLNAEYEAIDTEKQIEEAAARDHTILFSDTVSLLARQHYIYGEDRERHIVDMVFYDTNAHRVILVELKRGRLEASHREQLRRYLDRAGESEMIRRYMDDGCPVVGLLASPDPGGLEAGCNDIEIRPVEGEKVISILRQLRETRFGKRSGISGWPPTCRLSDQDVSTD